MRTISSFQEAHFLLLLWCFGYLFLNLLSILSTKEVSGVVSKYIYLIYDKINCALILKKNC